MRWFRKTAGVVLIAAACWMTGCIEYRIAAPQTSLVLSRGNARRVAHQRYPAYAHKQWSSLGLMSPVEVYFFWPAGAIFLDYYKFERVVRQPMKNVAFVAERRIEDLLIGYFSIGLAKHFTVGVYYNER